MAGRRAIPEVALGWVRQHGLGIVLWGALSIGQVLSRELKGGWVLRDGYGKESTFFFFDGVYKLKTTKEGKSKRAIVIGSKHSGIWKNGGLVRYSLHYLRAHWEIHISVKLTTPHHQTQQTLNQHSKLTQPV